MVSHFPFALVVPTKKREDIDTSFVNVWVINFWFWLY